MAKLAEMFGRFLAPILKPIILEALREYFTDKAEVAKSNPALDDAWNDGLLPEETSDVHPDGSQGVK